MSYESRLDRLEQITRGKAWKPLNRPGLLRRAMLTEAEAEGLTNSFLAGLADRRDKGDPWLILEDGSDLVLARVRFPTKDGWREATPDEFALYQHAIERLSEEY